MKNLLTLTAETLVQWCADRPTADVNAACNDALRFLEQHGAPLTARRAFVLSVRRSLRRRKRAASARILTAQGKTGSARERIASSLERAIGRPVDLSDAAEPSLLGGAVLSIDDERLDASLRSALQNLYVRLQSF